MSKRINLYIPEEQIYKDFKKAVGKRYNGIYHTNLGLELQTAIINYLADAKVPGYKHSSIHNDTSKDTSDQIQVHTHKLSRTDQILIDYLYINNADFDRFDISYKSLCRIMTSECDLKSKATHNRHIRYLLSKNILNEPANIPEFTTYFILKSKLKEFISVQIMAQEVD